MNESVSIIDEVGAPCEAELWYWGGKTMAVVGNRVILPRAYTTLVPEAPRAVQAKWVTAPWRRFTQTR